MNRIPKKFKIFTKQNADYSIKIDIFWILWIALFVTLTRKDGVVICHCETIQRIAEAIHAITRHCETCLKASRGNPKNK